LFSRDTFFATVSVFLVIGLLFYNPLNTYIFNPVKVTLSDFSFNDLAFSKVHETFSKDERIIIINIDTAHRKSIADLLLRVAQDSPQVIGLDVLFGAQSDVSDTYLAKTLASVPHLVVSYQSLWDDAKGADTPLISSLYTPSADLGYVNFVGEDLGVIRYYKPFIKKGDRSGQSFTSAITQIDDSAAYDVLAQRNHPLEWINYRRNASGYYIVNGSDLMDNKVESHFLKHKIVLIGYVATSPYNIEDKHFTPLNEKLLGRSIPDMNGVIIHANILSMILDGKYISRSPFWLNLLLAMVITWVHIAFLLKYYIHHHIWFHLVVKTVELGVGALLVYLNILALQFFDISVDFTMTLLCIITAVDVLYFYEAFSHWLNRKYAVQTIFNPNHHE
jgi:CHASE2 domain-containing sensor protein